MRTRAERTRPRRPGNPRPSRIVRAAAAAVLTMIAATQPATALPGPDPADAPAEFSIDLEEQNTGTVYDRLFFTRTAGWDFGDREAYRCAFVERFDAQGNLLFKIEIEQNLDYPVPSRINDHDGLETGEGGVPPLPNDICGSSPGVNDNRWLHNPPTEDHFPHHTHQHLFVDGVEDTTAYLDLHRDDCARGYWTPGDQAGEAILWWDEDGPQHTHPDGPPLPCGGGNQEPLAVARMLVIPVAANAGVCTHDEIDGSRCAGLTAPQPGPDPGDHRSSVTLRLRGHLRASGFVRARDGFGECTAARTVRVQRRVDGHWRTEASEMTTSSGYYSLRLQARSGTYRTRVTGAALASGDVCQTAVSHKRVFEG